MRYRGAAGALGTLLSCVMVAGVSTAAAEEGRPESTVSLAVLLTLAPTLPEAARGPFLDEVTRIWRGQNIRIEWLPATENPPFTGRSLRVLVMPRRGPATRQGDSLAVGELLGSGNGHAVAIVSINAAERLLDETRPPGFRALTPLGLRALTPLDHGRLGVVLGRAAAHEIGHYLLATHTHARHGLMRPYFDAREFAGHRSDPFLLDSVAAAWLKERLARDAAIIRDVEPVRFSYVH